MTVSSLTTKNSHSGDGSTSVFPYTFKIFDEDDVTVIIRTDSTGTEAPKSISSGHYTVSGVGNTNGGNVTFTSGNIPASGETVLLLRNTPLTQATDYTPNDPFPAATHEDALDKLTLISQDAQEEIGRSIKLSRANTMTSTEFSVPAATRANKVLGFDASGELTVTQELGTFKGDWAASTSYVARDLVRDTSTTNIFIVNEAHTSSGSVPLTTNTNSSKYTLILESAFSGVTAGTVSASKGVLVDGNKDVTGFRNVTLTGELDAATLDISGNADIDGTLEADAMTLNGTAITATATLDTGISNNNVPKFTSGVADNDFLRVDGTAIEGRSASEVLSDISAAPAAGSSNIVTTGALDSGSITSGFGTIDTGSSNITTTGLGTFGSVNIDGGAIDGVTIGTNSAVTDLRVDNLKLDGNTISSTNSNGAVTIDPNGTGNVALGNFTFDADQSVGAGQDNYVLKYDNSAGTIQLEAETTGGLSDIVNDSSPQLGGALDTNSNNIEFGDNDKALFGAGSDLQIYHDGTDSHVADNGTGRLLVRSNGASINFLKDTSETMAVMSTDGGVELYHDNSKKIETTSTGATITGDATFTNSDAGTIIARVGTNVAGIKTSSGDDFCVGTDAFAQAIRIKNDTGRVGIGTTAPEHLLDVSGDVSGPYLMRIFNDGDNVNRKGLKIQCGQDSGDQVFIAFEDGDGSSVGSIQGSSGTASYNTFTAGHPAILPSSDAAAGYPYGTLVETTGITYSTDSGGNTTRNGIIYSVQKSSSANSKSVLGAYASKDNVNDGQHIVYVLGDGHILCNNSGGNIAVGDGICTSATAGIGQKATASPSMIIGIAQEAVTFANDSETKLVPVQYGLQQFTPWS